MYVGKFKFEVSLVHGHTAVSGLHIDNIEKINLLSNAVKINFFKPLEGK